MLDKYLNEEYLRLVNNNYEEYYLNSLDYDNFNKVYDLLIKYNYTCISDIILYYLEVFDIDYTYVENALKDMTEDYPKEVSKDIRLFNNIVLKAIEYSEEDI